MKSFAYRVPVANRPRHHQLRVGVDRSPRPTVASTIRGGLRARDILLLAANETPDFIPLNAPGLHVADGLVMECLTGSARVRHAGDRTHGRSLAEHGEDLDTLGMGQLVHAAFVLLPIPIQ